MASVARSQTPLDAPAASGRLPRPRLGSRPNSFAASSSAGGDQTFGSAAPSAAAHPSRFHEDLDVSSLRGSVSFDAPRSSFSIARSPSRSATPTRAPSTLQKKSSLSKRGSMRRSGSRRSLRAGSVRSLVLGDKEKYSVDGEEDHSSAFHVPIPTTGSPTDVLANRFQSWRKILKDLIMFFKEIQKSYETRSKLFLSASNVINNSVLPPSFLKTGGLADATDILRDFHRQGYMEANKAAEVENEVVNQLMGLRNDLQKKTKEIRGLSGDFRNSVDKEVEGTRKTVRHLHEALGLVDTDPHATSGKGDPFIVRLSVDKQIEKQIEEENYLHRAFLNLENSGRELESIVVSEIQKAYNAYASILKREADEAYDTAEKLQSGPISMPHDHEWNSFIATTDELVDPRVPLRDVENISYPGKDHPAAAEVRSGMLERKSKYLKSYTPGWYVLSPTHLHEFKSADRVAWQTPVMSLYLPEQKLGSHSQPESTSHKFMLKGRQTGTMHRGHSWVFRAESHETMKAWYEDIESLISKTGEARNAFVRRHVRTISGTSFRTSTDGIMDEEDEADRTPYSPESAVLNHDQRPASQPREPGGRFPSDVQIDRSMQDQDQDPLSPSSGESSGDRDLLLAAAAGGSLPDGAPFDRQPDHHQQPGDPTTKPSVDGAYLSPGTRDAAADSEQGSTHSVLIAGLPSHQQRQQQFQGYNNNPDPKATSTPSVMVAGLTTTTTPPGTDFHRARGESSSTAPTSSTTDQTHNTIPSSIDEHDGNRDSADLNAAAVRKNSRVSSIARSSSARAPSLGRMDSGSRSRDSSPMVNGAGAGAARGDLKRTVSANNATASGEARPRASVSTLELLSIPGRYEPAHVSA